MRVAFLIASVIFFNNLNAQQLEFGLMDKSLIDDANVVIRNSLTEFEVINEGKAIETNYIELTILNESGKREATQLIPYDDLTKVLSYSGRLYDKSGKLVKKIKNSQVNDVSASGGSMYTDNRLKVLNFDYPSYPYSIVLEYQLEHDGLMFYPSWYPQDNIKTSVEKASLTVIVPKSIGLNYFEHSVAVTKRNDDDKLIHLWEVEGIKGFDLEPFGPPIRELVPYVLLTPKKFEMEGYKGSMTTWESIGLYENKLLQGKEKLPLEAITALNKQIEGISDKREKVKRIYEYVQNSTRYVSVQLGIGGWQPYDASYVYENGYGDCKALSNYTMALLNHVGIHSIYTNVLAGGGESDIITEFPNSRFNHIILAVPFEKDTVWLECTSQKNPFGYTGSFTSDRHVLLITDAGGKIVKTPTYTKEQNTQKRVISIELDKNGDASAEIVTEYAGIQYENVNHQLYESVEDQKKWLQKKISLDKTQIKSLTYDYSPGVVPKITQKIKITSQGFGSVTGTRIFFKVNPLNRLTNIPKKIKERKTPTHISTAYTDIDSVYFKLPEGYHVEYMPENKNIKNQFGVYKTTYKLTENGLLYVRKLISEKGVFPAESYEEHRNMLKEISSSDKTKVVLVGST